MLWRSINKQTLKDYSYPTGHLCFSLSCYKIASVFKFDTSFFFCPNLRVSNASFFEVVSGKEYWLGCRFFPAITNASQLVATIASLIDDFINWCWIHWDECSINALKQQDLYFIFHFWDGCNIKQSIRVNLTNYFVISNFNKKYLK